MKRFLRHAACLAAIFLLAVCPMKAFAANIAPVDETGSANWPGDAAAPTRGSSGNSIFEIQKVEKYWYVFLQVLDGDSNPADPHYVAGSPQNVPLSGYEVKLTSVGVPDSEIAGFYGRAISTASVSTVTTDENGKIGFRVPKPMNGGTRQVTVTLPSHEGYMAFTPVTITLSDKETTPEPLWFLPIHLDVMFAKGAKGDLYNRDGSPFDYSTPIVVRWGERLDDKMPVVKTVADEWAHTGWLITAVSPYEETPGWQPVPGWDKGDTVSVKALDEHQFEYNLSLTAVYKRAYLVRYSAGDYGYLSGNADHRYPNGDYWERVVGGEKPRMVPTPVPMSEREYRFVKWRVDQLFNYDSIDPASVAINGDTDFQAVFDVRKRQPVVITTPTTGQNPTAPTSESAALPVIGGIGGGPGGGKGGPGGGTGGANGGAEVQAAQETQPAGQSGTLPQSPPEETEQGNAGAVPAAPATGQTGSKTSLWSGNWPILLCTLLTMAGGTLRIMDIRRTVKRFADPQNGEAEREKIRVDGPRPLVTETVLGIICLILWGYFYANRGSRWDLMALILWGVILVVMAVLLLRAERGLRHRTEETKEKD